LPLRASTCIINDILDLSRVGAGKLTSEQLDFKTVRSRTTCQPDRQMRENVELVFDIARDIATC
jgi:hypothetical protein